MRRIAIYVSTTTTAVEGAELPNTITAVDGQSWPSPE